MEASFTEELKSKLQPGNKIKIFYNKGNHNNHIRHIRAIIDDEYIVYKRWSNRKGWRYLIDWYYDFLLLDYYGNMKVIK